LICGGETTISIIGSPEKGGPNQESVFGFSKKMRQKQHMAFVCIDTDGTDGPTDMAGGISDGFSKGEMKKLGIDYQDIFQKHGTYDALNCLHDGIYTGNTGTNVMNMRVVVITKPENK
jgi:glycerate-2-kinase